MLVRNVILDWPGTLVDDLMPVFKTANHVFEACGCPPISLQKFRADSYRRANSRQVVTTSDIFLWAYL